MASDHVPGTSGPADVERMKANEIHFKSLPDQGNKVVNLADRLTEPRTLRPCPSEARGPFLGAYAQANPFDTVWLRCGHTEGHDGPHTFRVEWEGEPMGTCDWGDCDDLAVTWRTSPEHGRLPVCESHAATDETGLGPEEDR